MYPNCLASNRLMGCLSHLRIAPIAVQARSNRVGDKGRVVLSIARDQTMKRNLEEIRIVLRKSKGHSRQRLEDRKAAAMFAITAPNLKYPPLTIALRAYRFWLEHDGDTDKAARAYYAWATKFNGRIARRNKEREADKLGKWRDAVEEVGWEDKQSKAKGEAHLAFAKYQQQIWRYIRKGRRIAENVAAGVFPGDYAD